MAYLSVKDVPDSLAERLRQRAARNHRSLQGELMAIIEQAAYEADLEPAPAPAPAPRPAAVGVGWNGRPILRRGGKTIEQIAAEHRARFPQPVRGGPDAVDIIRAERDAR
jgi:plasmid stability protein